MCVLFRFFWDRKQKKKNLFEWIALTNLTIIDSDSNGEKKPHELQLKPSDKRFERKILTLVVINFRTVCFFPRSFPIFCPRYGQTRFSHHTRSLSIPYNFSFGNIFLFIPFCLFTYLALKRNYESHWWERGQKKNIRKKNNTPKSYTRIVICLSTVRIIVVYFFLYTRSFFSWLLCMLFMFCST